MLTDITPFPLSNDVRDLCQIENKIDDFSFPSLALLIFIAPRFSALWLPRVPYEGHDKLVTILWFNEVKKSSGYKSKVVLDESVKHKHQKCFEIWSRTKTKDKIYCSRFELALDEDRL